MAENDDKKQVMISLNVKTCHDIANRLKNFLEDRGISVWICTGMDAGDDFRDEIVDAIDECEIFLALMNDAWANSKECKYEFNLAQRLSLVEDKPIIMPVLFSDLDWNGTKHVRLCLANTNGIPYNPEEEEKCFLKMYDSMIKQGVKPKGQQNLSENAGEVKAWNNKKVCENIAKIATAEFEKRTIDGKTLMTLNTTQLKNEFGLSERQVKSLKVLLGTGTDCHPSEGEYKVQGKTVNNYDKNETESNEFRMFLKDQGIASSGMVWGTGTLHANYSDVTCIWQGTYNQDTGEASLKAVYSNNTNEDMTGVLDFKKNTFNGDYIWYGYGRKSSGKFYFNIKKT